MFSKFLQSINFTNKTKIQTYKFTNNTIFQKNNSVIQKHHYIFKPYCTDQKNPHTEKNNNFDICKQACEDYFNKSDLNKHYKNLRDKIPMYTMKDITITCVNLLHSLETANKNGDFKRIILLLEIIVSLCIVICLLVLGCIILITDCQP